MLPATMGITGTQGQQNPTAHDAIQDVDLDEFLKLLITELQNQDPMDPMENSEILQQLSQIREVESNLRLTDTLESLHLGQNLATASSMIGRSIIAVTDEGLLVAGSVDAVSIEDGAPKLSVGEHVVDLKNVSQIFDEATPTT
jgi:flagellar basal-body rod modification protein FlgD